MIQLRLPLEPFGAARTGTRAVPTGRFTKGRREIWSTQHYMNRKYRKWREAAMVFFLAQAPKHPISGPVALSLVIVMPFRKGDARKTMFVPRKWHTARPDFDNVAKAIMDCAQDAGWFLNDWQVSRCVAEKVYAAQGEKACIHITLKELEPYGS